MFHSANEYQPPGYSTKTWGLPDGLYKRVKENNDIKIAKKEGQDFGGTPKSGRYTREKKKITHAKQRETPQRTNLLESGSVRFYRTTTRERFQGRKQGHLSKSGYF